MKKTLILLAAFAVFGMINSADAGVAPETVEKFRTACEDMSGSFHQSEILEKAGCWFEGSSEDVSPKKDEFIDAIGGEYDQVLSVDEFGTTNPAHCEERGYCSSSDPVGHSIELDLSENNA
ncbi:MAG: hypothetical protein LBH81_03135 [Rickettsiales bacterium]|jgi:hypothetical protein|nr:hypothetical protein [Rickettsiales bacterium]